MGWKDNLRPASFRGISFFVDTSTITTGRRVAVHEFPDRDNPFPEDLGKVSRSFTVEAHILGDDYFEIKTSLISAFEQKGTGELVHPYFGTLKVQSGAFTVNEDSGQGRIAAVSMQFYEAGSSAFPSNIEDKKSIVEKRSASTIEAAKNEFDSKFSIAGLPGYAVQTSRDQIASLTETFTSSTSGLVTVSESASKLAFGNRNLIAETDTLLQSPSVLSSRIVSSFGLLEDSIPDFKSKAKSISNFSAFGLSGEVISGDTPTRIKQKENQETFNNFIKQVSIAKNAEYSANTEFNSLSEANEKREEISALIEEQKELTSSDDIFQEMQALNAIIVKTIPDIDNELPNIETVVPRRTTNSLLVTYDLFENLESEQDLINRNGIKNPAFIEQGVSLEVIDVRKK